MPTEADLGEAARIPRISGPAQSAGPLPHLAMMTLRPRDPDHSGWFKGRGRAGHLLAAAQSANGQLRVLKTPEILGLKSYCSASPCVVESA